MKRKLKKSKIKKTIITEAGCFPALFAFVLWACQFQCKAQIMSMPHCPFDSLNSAEILNLDSVFSKKCVKWSEIPGIKSMKMHEYIDEHGEKNNFVRAKFGDIEYIIDKWQVSDDENGEPEVYYGYVSTFDPKFEYLGYRVGQHCDSLTQPALPSDGHNLRKIQAPLSWNIIVENDTVRMMYRKEGSDSPCGLIDNVMLANRNHIPTKPEYESYLNDCKLHGKKNESKLEDEKVGRAVRNILEERFGLVSNGAFRPMYMAVKDIYDTPCFKARNQMQENICRDTLSLDSLIFNMPESVADITEIQNVSGKDVHSFVDVAKGKTINKPYIVATLNGIEYMLMLDYDAPKDIIFVSGVMTYDPNFELKGYSISDAGPSYFYYGDQFYDLTDHKIYKDWHCVAKDSKIIYFYKDLWIRINSRDDSLTHAAKIVDEVMLKQKP